ncbi:unnamed protein product [Arctia plantaginis]|uniref:Fucosyltransferase n=1 Tax=Arctia plantaginis TaxID=874455 RepID=A0A8S0ZG51_ARCPL|nr:unnamed protein product [Arctia plantaginis]
MTWIEPMAPTPAKVKEKIANKKKAAAWFVSHCETRSNRGAVAQDIQNELQKRGHVVDIFGWCGKKTCPKDRFEDCLSLLESDYYFYMSFENCFSEDYVTEVILHPLQYHTVPIVYGGANYSRFLPPNSYIDARQLNATQVADEMVKAIKNKTMYENYFRWHNYYNYIDSRRSPDVCKLCQILNEESHIHSSIKDFLGWWNLKDYIPKCGEGEGMVLMKDQLFLQPVVMDRM